MGRMMIESLANGRDGCMHGCFGFTRIIEEACREDFWGQGKSIWQHCSYWRFVPGRFPGPAGGPHGNIAMIGVCIPGLLVPVERWACERETHAVSIIFLI